MPDQHVGVDEPAHCSRPARTARVRRITSSQAALRLAAGTGTDPARPRKSGVRATIAFLVLLLALAVATVLFATVGFGRSQQTVYVPIRSPIVNQPVAYKQTTVPDGKPGFREAAYYSVQSATSLLREPTSEPLTTIGRFTEITLRLLGPLLLGLAVLALRGRVKR